jgi:mono/diheme cytochrome c family protein
LTLGGWQNRKINRMPNGSYLGALFGALALGLFALVSIGGIAATNTAEIERAKYLWSQSPYGKLLERILPPSIGPSELPEPRSMGARIMARYCVQCHYLPSPEMHAANKWTVIVVRMVWRMRGKGNLGAVMKEMMDRVEAPSDEEVRVLNAYLRKYGQREMDPMHPALRSEAGQMYTVACTQCHGLPDPRRHTAREWPSVVERMKRHMAWANTVVGVDELRTIPVLDTAEIVRFLQRHARPDRKPN